MASLEHTLTPRTDGEGCKLGEVTTMCKEDENALDYDMSAAHAQELQDREWLELRLASMTDRQQADDGYQEYEQLRSLENR